METKCLETEVLLRSLEEDEEGLRELVMTMLPGEQWLLQRACWRVINALAAASLARWNAEESD